MGGRSQSDQSWWLPWHSNIRTAASLSISLGRSLDTLSHKLILHIHYHVVGHGARGEASGSLSLLLTGADEGCLLGKVCNQSWKSSGTRQCSGNRERPLRTQAVGDLSHQRNHRADLLFHGAYFLHATDLNLFRNWHIVLHSKSFPMNNFFVSSLSAQKVILVLLLYSRNEAKCFPSRTESV